MQLCWNNNFTLFVNHKCIAQSKLHAIYSWAGIYQCIYLKGGWQVFFIKWHWPLSKKKEFSLSYTHELVSDTYIDLKGVWQVYWLKWHWSLWIWKYKNIFFKDTQDSHSIFGVNIESYFIWYCTCTKSLYLLYIVQNVLQVDMNLWFCLWWIYSDLYVSVQVLIERWSPWSRQASQLKFGGRESEAVSHSTTFWGLLWVSPLDVRC